MTIDEYGNNVLHLFMKINIAYWSILFSMSSNAFFVQSLLLCLVFPWKGGSINSTCKNIQVELTQVVLFIFFFHIIILFNVYKFKIIES